MKTTIISFKHASYWCIQQIAPKIAVILLFMVFLAGNCIAQVTQEWVQKFNLTGNLMERPQASAVDAEGNVYITGYYADAVEDYNFITVKFNSSGTVAWSRTYNNAPQYSDYANAIAVDDEGNVYVTGNSYYWLYFYCITIKYNSEGEEQWVRPLYGFGYSGNGIAVDGSGNVFVAGSATGTSSDVILLKYSSDGIQQWIKRYNSPGNQAEIAKKIKLTSSGDIYLMGASKTVETDYDYLVMKYNANGDQQWIQTYNSDGNGSDNATSFAVDDFGSVYLTGYSTIAGTGYNYITIKYTSEGVQEWIQRYYGPNTSDYAPALAIDGSGNTYITGNCCTPFTSFDYVTIKYNSSGVEQWIKKYNNNISYDQAYAIALDVSGNIYVTGYSAGSGSGYDFATIKYDPEGTQLWIKRCSGPGNGNDQANGIGIDGSGNIYVMGFSTGTGTSYDYTSVKYTSDGEEQWIGRYNGTGNTKCIPKSMAGDYVGNIYITGSNSNVGSQDDFLTVKYNSSGELQWFTTYNGTSNSYDNAQAIAVDIAGNICITGSSYNYNLGRSYDYTTVKYNSEGNEQWVKNYNGPSSSSDQATAIAMDDAGYVYVTGYSYQAGTYYDFVTIKYNSEGVEQWIQRYNGTANKDDQATAIKVDSFGNVYVTGYSNTSSNNPDYATVKYNSSGAMQWVAIYNGTGNGEDKPVAIGLDGSGNIYVTGYSAGSGTGFDYATIKYNSEGNLQWVRRYHGQGNLSDYATSMAVEVSGNIYVTGASASSGGYDYATIKYNTDSVQEWIQRYACPGNLPDRATAIKIDDWGYVYVTGTSYPSGQSNDFATIKYSPAGSVEWTIGYSDLFAVHDDPIGISIDGSGNVYVSGYRYTGCTGSFETVKYSQVLSPFAPVLTSPEDGSLDLSLTPLLQWNAALYAISYNVQVAENQDFSNLIDDQTGITVTLYQIPEDLLSTNTIYYWRISAENYMGTSDWSAVWNFKTYATPQDIIMEMIAIINSYEDQRILNHGQANSLRVKLYHSIDKINGGEYEVAINTLNAFINEVQAYIAANTLTPEQGQILIDKACLVITMLQSADGRSVGIPGDLSPSQGLWTYTLGQNYPNPFNSSTTIRYSLSSGQVVTLKVYDLFGDELLVLVNGYQSAGEHSIIFSAEGFPGGVYYYRMQAGRFSATKKFIVKSNH